MGKCWWMIGEILALVLLIGLSVLCEQRGPWPERHESQPPQSSDATSITPLSPGSTASQLAAAILAPSTAAFLVSSSLSGSDVQAEVFTTALLDFPLCGNSYAVLSTGIAANAPGAPVDFESVDVGGPFIGGGSPEGYDAFDVVTLTLQLSLPSNARSLKFCFKFATEENPTYLNSVFQDFFTATVKDSSGAAIAQIARLPNGNIVTVDKAAVYSNAVGGTSESPEWPFPTPSDTVYNAVTYEFLVASCDVATYAGSTISIVFQLGDASDPVLASAVFIDCLQVTTADGKIDKWAVILQGDSGVDFPLDRKKMDLAFRYMWEIPKSSIKIFDGTFSDSVVRELVTWLGNKADGDDIVVFYYTGHGWSGGFGDITYEELADWFSCLVVAENTIIILDACESGGAISEISKSGRWILSACKADQDTMGVAIPLVGGGVFTHWLADAIMWGLYSPDLTHFVLGLGTIIDTNFDGKVSLREAHNYAAINTSLSFFHLIGKQGDPQMDPSTGDLIVPQRQFGWGLQILTFLVGSPVELVVTDPTGHVLGKITNQIGDNAFCVEGDFNDDGDLDMQCVIFDALPGKYSIEIIPKAGASPSDTYGLKVILNGTTTVLADNVPIADIPDEPYSFTVGPVLGDVNGDGVINVLDVRLCLQIATGFLEGTMEQRIAADVDSDGQVTRADAETLAGWVIGIED